MNSEGFTGLEAAIVLIAFVVVASVFSFAVLGAGFYTTSKAQEVMYSAVDSAGSTPQLLGNVYGLKKEGGSSVDRLRFSVDLSAGGNLIDFSSMSVTISTSKSVEDLELASTTVTTEENIAAGEWGVISVKPNGETDLFLESGEIFTVFVHLDASEEILASEKFTLEMKSPSSGAFALIKKVPSQIDTVNVMI